MSSRDRYITYQRLLYEQDFMHGTIFEPKLEPLLENQADINIFRRKIAKIDDILRDNPKLAKPKRQILINEHTPTRRLPQGMIQSLLNENEGLQLSYSAALRLYQYQQTHQQLYATIDYRSLHLSTVTKQELQFPPPPPNKLSEGCLFELLQKALACHFAQRLPILYMVATYENVITQVGSQ